MISFKISSIIIQRALLDIKDNIYILDDLMMEKNRVRIEKAWLEIEIKRVLCFKISFAGYSWPKRANMQRQEQNAN